MEIESEIVCNGGAVRAAGSPAGRLWRGGRALPRGFRGLENHTARGPRGGGAHRRLRGCDRSMTGGVISRSKVARRVVVLVLASCVGAAVAAPLTVPQIQVSTTNALHYSCRDGKSLNVTYMNTTNKQSFALVVVNGRKLLFVNVLSGSGAKYMADHFTWWTKGPEGTLTDNTADPNAPPLLAECKSAF